MIAAADDWKYAGRIDVGDRLRDLAERLFNVPGDNENVPGIAEVEFLIEVDPSVEPVTIIECGNSTDCLRTKPRAGPVCRCGIEWCTDKRGFVLADLANVLAVGGLH